MIKNITPFLLILLVTFFCSTCVSINDNQCDNICCQEPCYEGPFEPPWLSANDYGLEYIDENGPRMTCDNKVLETENVLTFSDASSDEIKIQYANMTEQSFADIKKEKQGRCDKTTQITL